MPPAFVLNTARHCHFLAPPCNLPLPFPLYSQFGLYALPLQAQLPACRSCPASHSPFHAPLLLIWQK